MSTDKYILDQKGEPKPAASLQQWAAMFENKTARRVASDTIGESQISTVFLGLDHNYEDSGPPILWETMVFGGKLNEEQDRCSGGREQAEAMHAKMVQRVKEACL